MSIKFIRTEDPEVAKDGWTVSMEIPNGVEIETLVDTFEFFLLGLSYHPSTVKQALGRDEE